MKTLRDIGSLERVKTLVRADFNVPIKNGMVVDDYRIRKTLPTIQLLSKKGAIVILISHLESEEDKPSLVPVVIQLKKLGVEAIFIKDFKAAHEIADNAAPGSVFLLENIRFFDGEKKNDPKFSKELASLADIYVNEAFSVSHREHASVVGLPKLMPSYVGIQFEKEIAELSRAFDPAHPFLFILGGAKFDTKLPLLKKFMNSADRVFVGGALANDFYKAKGYEVGTSLLSDGAVGGAFSQAISSYLDDPKLMLPIDIVTQNKETKAADSLDATDAVRDAGTETVSALKERVGSAKFILWNGPLGHYEDGFCQPTIELAKMVGDATESAGAVSIVGGGDTLAAIAELGIEDSFTFVSTGGGAMLDFLAKGTLPGIEALEKSEN